MRSGAQGLRVTCAAVVPHLGGHAALCASPKALAFQGASLRDRKLLGCRATPPRPRRTNTIRHSAFRYAAGRRAALLCLLTLWIWHLRRLLGPSIDYGFNMQLCLALGLAQSAAWVVWAQVTQHPARCATAYVPLHWIGWHFRESCLLLSCRAVEFGVQHCLALLPGARGELRGCATKHHDRGGVQVVRARLYAGDERGSHPGNSRLCAPLGAGGRARAVARRHGAADGRVVRVHRRGCGACAGAEAQQKGGDEVLKSESGCWLPLQPAAASAG